MPTVRDTLLALRAADVFRQHELDHLSIQEAVARLREKRIRETGLRQYVYDLLGDRANWESARFTLWRGGKGVSIPPKWRQRRLVDYLATLGELPERIEVEEGGRNIQLHM